MQPRKSIKVVLKVKCTQCRKMHPLTFGIIRLLSFMHYKAGFRFVVGRGGAHFELFCIEPQLMIIFIMHSSTIIFSTK